MIVVVIGRTCSGKTTIAQEIEKLTKWKKIDVSTLVKKIKGKQEQSKQLNRHALLDERHNHNDDPDWLWRELEKEVPANKSCVIVGLREPYLYYKLTQLYQQVVLLKVELDVLVRYCRLCERDGFISVDDFFLIEKKADDMGLNILLDSAHHYISTTGSLHETQLKLTKFLKSYTIELNDSFSQNKLIQIDFVKDDKKEIERKERSKNADIKQSVKINNNDGKKTRSVLYNNYIKHCSELYNNDETNDEANELLEDLNNYNDDQIIR